MPRRAGSAQGARVLIVDDEPEVLGAAVALFRMSGFEALSAGSGKAAIQILKETAGIKLLLTDVLMPRMDGVTLGREARKLVPGIKVILVSGFPTSAMEAHDGEPGEFQFLLKPFMMSELAIVLRR